MLPDSQSTRRQQSVLIGSRDWLTRSLRTASWGAIAFSMLLAWGGDWL
ncbi:MAG: hypothetical protein AAF609_22975 [Cyanobacteria bacterium P01_C01_bin.120]